MHQATLRHLFTGCLVLTLSSLTPAVALASTATTLPANSNIIKSPNDQRLYRSFSLPNHMKVLVISDPKADKAAGVHYYSRPEELCARAFEAFVQDAPVKNAFLVKGTKESEEAQLGLYPQGPQRESINRAFLAYFQSLGRALQRTDA